VDVTPRRFWIPYVEWTTPAIYRGFLHARGPRDFAEGAVTLFFLEKREKPAVVSGKPYATIERGDDVLDAGAYTREPGAIALRPTVPEGGGRLVVREQAFPGWVATVDGRETSLSATPLGFILGSSPILSSPTAGCGIRITRSA
jgi:hypothetical protein